MSSIKTTKSEIFITTGGFVAAAFMYVMVALEVLLGDLPSKGNHYSPDFYERNVGFFWTLVAIQAALGLYWLAGAIRDRWRQKTAARATTGKGNLSLDGILNIGAAVCIILVGLCFAIFPIIEIVNGKIYGGLIFKNHSLTAEPTLFWQLFVFHLIISFLPIVGGTLLMAFAPKRTQPIEVRLNYNAQF